MEVILREDVPHLGRAGNLVRVKPGYARNYLLPKGLAYEASEGNRKRIEGESRARSARNAAEKDGAQEQANRLGGIEIELTAKAGEGERLFGSITSSDIAEALAGKGFQVDRRRIDLDHPIKTLGEHSVTLRLHPEVSAVIKLRVAAE
jgi:large subunit ribosomal protein L9